MSFHVLRTKFINSYLKNFQAYISIFGKHFFLPCLFGTRIHNIEQVAQIKFICQERNISVIIINCPIGIDLINRPAVNSNKAIWKCNALVIKSK